MIDDGDYGKVVISDKNYTDHVTFMSKNLKQRVFDEIEAVDVTNLRICGVTTTSGREGVSYRT